MSADVVKKIAESVRIATQGEKFQQYAREGGIALAPSSPEALGARLEADIALWTDVVKKADIRLAQP